MKSLAGILLLSAAALAPLHAQLTGLWSGEATYKGQQIPLTIEFTGTGPALQAVLRNGPESSPASSTKLVANHLMVTFDYFARTIDATLDRSTLTGTFGSTATRVPFTLHPFPGMAEASGAAAKLAGDWEIQVKSAKGEAAWLLRVDPPPTRGSSTPLRAVIQRIDGDTGSLFSRAGPAGTLRFSHFTAAGPALYSIAPQADGTLLVSNLLNAEQTNLVARRPDEARKKQLPEPTDPARQTSMKDPAAPFRFSFPDLTRKVVSNTDAQFDGKVVIVAVGGSWCPNCHDEAPLLESLYKRFHSRGLEIVSLSFEEADQLKDPARLRAFIARYGITYTVLLPGDPDDLNKKIPQAENLNSWPTSFFLGRDGRVKEVHAGFAGPANPVAHAQLEKDVTALVEGLLAEPTPTRTASSH